MGCRMLHWLAVVDNVEEFMGTKKIPPLILTILFATALVPALCFSRHPGSNVYCRVGMTYQMVDAGTFNIDPWKGQTHDYSQAGDHIYNDKAPGVSYLLTAPYLLIKIVAKFTTRHVSYETARYFMRILSLLPLCLLAAVLGMAYLRKIGADSLWFAPVWLLGTTAFPFSVVIFGHQYAAGFMLIAFALLYRLRTDPEWGNRILPLVLAGALCGLSILTEFPTALLALALGLYLLSFERRPGRVGIFGAVGVGLPAVGIGLYNWACFGKPWVFGYQNLNNPGNLEGMSHGIMGVGLPKLSSLWEITFSPAGGLFFTAPFLLFGFFGLVLLIKNKTTRPEGILFAGAIAAYFAFNAGYWEPGGAMSFGPRHLVPMIPFLVLAAFYSAAKSGPVFRGIFWALAVTSVFMTLLGTAADPAMPDRLANPVNEFAVPILANGFGLEGVLGLIGPTLLMAFVAIALATVIAVFRLQSGQKKHEKFTNKTRIAFVCSIFVLVFIYGFVLPKSAQTDPGTKFQVLGNYYMSREAFALAEKDYQAAAQYRNDPYIHYYRGRALAKLRRLDEMKQEFMIVLAIDPNFPYREMLMRVINLGEHEQ